MAKRGALRASDADRDQIIDRLRNASAEGRLALHEFEHRLTDALTARTYADLEATVADLPGKRRSAQSRVVRTLRDHPTLLLVTIPLALVAVATLVAVTVLWCVLVFALFLLRHRRYRHRGPWAYRTRGRFGPPHSGHAPWS